MSRHKGIVSNSAIDRDWPYQVALSYDFVGENFRAIQEFTRPLSNAPRSLGVTAIGPGALVVPMFVYCFADPADADSFAARFDGSPFDPKRDRGRGAKRDKWERT